MKPKIMNLHADFFQLSQDLIQPCDVIVLHNVFEWFGNKKQHQQAWQKVRQLFTKKGLYLVTCPSIEQSLKNAQLTIADLNTWIKEVPLQYPDSHLQEHEHDPNDEEDNLIHLYQVL